MLAPDVLVKSRRIPCSILISSPLGQINCAVLGVVRVFDPERHVGVDERNKEDEWLRRIGLEPFQSRVDGGLVIV
jgi:hypothetical protein